MFAGNLGKQMFSTLFKYDNKNFHKERSLMVLLSTKHALSNHPSFPYLELALFLTHSHSVKLIFSPFVNFFF